MPAITNCVVSKDNVNVITNPTGAVLNDDMKPTVNIVITGGTRNGLKKDTTYKITGRVGNNDRTFLLFKCKDAGDPATFVKAG
jgi:hypothetical protein